MAVIDLTEKKLMPSLGEKRESLKMMLWLMPFTDALMFEVSGSKNFNATLADSVYPPQPDELVWKLRTESVDGHAISGCG